MERVIKQLSVSFPCRKDQIIELFELIGYIDEPMPDSVFVYGHTGTGKTCIIKRFLELIEINRAFVNLVECYSNKILFESILNQLSGHIVTSANNYQSYVKCDNAADFIEHLRELSRSTYVFPAVIVLDKIERLRSNGELLSVFLRLKELTELPICTVMLSDIVFENFIPTSCKKPAIVFFQQYTKEQLLQILRLLYKECKVMVETNDNLCQKLETNERDCFEVEMDFFENYLNLFLSVFYRACRDVSELKYNAKLNFIKYCEPIVNKEIDKNDVSKLWRYVAPILKSSLEDVYLRIDGAKCETQKTKPLTFVTSAKKTLDFNNRDGHSVETKYAQTLELPFYAKYLLIAAFLASYNPPREDKQLFMKNSGKKRKTKQQIKSKAKVSDKLNIVLGPKQFTLDRLLAIFYAILGEPVGLTSNLLIQLSSLVELKLLTTIGNGSQLDGSKYKCIVDLPFIQTVSKMVGFNIKNYLYDLI